MDTAFFGELLLDIMAFDLLGKSCLDTVQCNLTWTACYVTPGCDFVCAFPLTQKIVAATDREVHVCDKMPAFSQTVRQSRPGGNKKRMDEGTANQGFIGLYRFVPDRPRYWVTGKAFVTCDPFVAVLR